MGAGRNDVERIVVCKLGGSYMATALPPADSAPAASTCGAAAAQHIHNMKQVTRELNLGTISNLVLRRGKGKVNISSYVARCVP